MNPGSKPNVVYKGRMERFDDAVWLIWSNKWMCWYRPESKGYTADIAEAGLFSKEDAASHYTSPDQPKQNRITEPFPVSAVRKHVAICRKQTEAEYAARIKKLEALEAALERGVS